MHVHELIVYNLDDILERRGRKIITFSIKNFICLTNNDNIIQNVIVHIFRGYKIFKYYYFK